MPSRVTELESLSAIALALLVVGLLTGRPALAWCAAVLLAITLFAKPAAAILARCWLKFASVLGGINNRVLLSIVFFLALTPLAYVYRLLHRDVLERGARERDSLFVERNHEYTRADLEKMW